MKLPALFSDHMVLQQGKFLPVWGEGSGKVCVRLGDQRAYALCEEGHWHCTLPPMPAGGPYTMTVQDEHSSVSITDVMIGEVWLAAGQSNMEHPTFAVEDGLARAAAGVNERIRFFTVPRRTRPDFTGRRWHFESVAAVDTGWDVCSEESILHFSAIGAFFAQLLEKAEQTAVYMPAKGDAPPKASLKLNKEAKNERRLHKAVKKDAELGMVFGHQHHKAVCSPDF